MNREPWIERYVQQARPSNANVVQLEAVLADARDEAPLQGVLAQTPSLLRTLLPSATDVWCFDRPQLGSEFIPDFLLCYRNSRGFNWVLVEIESPTKPPLNKAGRIAVKLNEAQGQISDWRIWLRQNISYAQSQLGLRQIDAEIPAVIIIGRRYMIESKNAARYRELSNGSTQVMTFDRLIDAAKAGYLLEE